LNDTAVLGFTGFVGSNIVKQLPFPCDLYNSKNFNELKGKTYKRIYCACVSGVKWKANLNPKDDYINISKIIKILETVECEEFYLVSSQDCNSSLESDEEFNSLPPTIYGIHRLQFEWFISSKFPTARIMRIGCLFGDGLKKNIIYDLLNQKDFIDTTKDITYQLYYIGNIVKDFEYMKDNNIMIMNRFSESVYSSEIAEALGIEIKFNNKYYKYNNKGNYILSKKEQLKLLKEWSKR
jgi:nucleoside-diphosphate-sugar epimerase